MGCSDDVVRCGRTPGAAEMIPDEVVVLCGEWETGPTPRELSGENYNLVLDVKEIIQHPDFDAGLGLDEGSDLGRALWKKIYLNVLESTRNTSHKFHAKPRGEEV